MEAVPRSRPSESVSLDPAFPADASRVAAELQLRRMGLHDLEAVANLHVAEFPDGFFVKLGARFLRRYYRTFLDGPMATALVCVRDEVVCGYLVGVLEPTRHRRLMLRYHGPSLAAHGLLSLSTRPALAAYFLRTRAARYTRGLMRHVQAQPISTSGHKVAVLTYVAVGPTARRTGVASRLVQRFLEQASDAGCTTARLVTVVGVGGAEDFYQALGWEHIGRIRRSNGQMVAQYRYDLSARR